MLLKAVLRTAFFMGGSLLKEWLTHKKAEKDYRQDDSSGKFFKLTFLFKQ